MSLEKLRKLKCITDDILKDEKEQEFISTGVGTLNILFGGAVDRGIPKGKISMIAADSSLGKSIISLKIAKNAQKKGMNIILFDTEKAYSKDTAKSIGIDLDKIIVIQKTSLEEVTTQFMNIMKEIESEKDDYLFIIDSWNALVSSKTVDDATSGKDVVDMTTAKKKNSFAKLLLNADATVFIVNQIYACVSPETLVKTDKGIRPMKEVKEGDIVFTSEGLQKVLKKVQYENVLQYDIEFESGEKVICSGFHRFINEETGEWICAEDIQQGMKLKGLNEKVTIVKTSGNGIVQDIETPCHNYILGNGLISHNTMSQYDLDAIPGGKGIFFSSSCIVQATSKAKDKTSDGEIEGAIITAQTRKGRFAREHSKLKYLIKYDGGFNPYYGLLDIALEGGFVTKPSVGWYQKANEDKKYREKDVYCKEFWGDIIASDEFKEYVEKAYSVKHNDFIDEDI